MLTPLVLDYRNQEVHKQVREGRARGVGPDVHTASRGNVNARSDV